MTQPIDKTLRIRGLGFSVGTSRRLKYGEAIVVKAFDDLFYRSSEIQGKIVVYNFNFTSYAEQVKFVRYGGLVAAEFGAIAALVRSVTPISFYNPHADREDPRGDYEDKIPAISITVEDAESMQRFQDRGEKISLRFYSENHMQERKISRNTVSEITGSTNPNEVVIISGHLDCWDVGQGAMNDGAGAVISWLALSVLKDLNLRPRLTLRSVLWTAEEMGLVGSRAYFRKHEDEMFSYLMEGEIGTFAPTGVKFSGKSLTSQCIISEILRQFPENFDFPRILFSDDESGQSLFRSAGIPISSLDSKNDDFYSYHHSESDTMSAIDPDQLDKNAALWTGISYAVSMLDRSLPR